MEDSKAAISVMQKRKYKVSVIIPHYNRKECLERLLPSIANQTFADYEVIIMDDFTPDRSVLEYIGTLIKEYKNIRLISNDDNLGFVQTCNRGIGLADGYYICLLNQDTEVKSNFIEKNVEILDADSSIGVLSCILVDQEGNNWFTGGSFKGGLPVNLTDDFEGIRTVDFVAGTAPFYRREVFDRIGLFDENYRMYHEDVEFGLRLHAKTNYKACMFPEKLVVHYIVRSMPKLELYYLSYRNLIMLVKKYSPNHIPKVLLHISREIIMLPIDPLLNRKPKSFFLSFGKIMLLIIGTLDGLTRRQRA